MITTTWAILWMPVRGRSESAALEPASELLPLLVPVVPGPGRLLLVRPLLLHAPTTARRAIAVESRLRTL